MSFRHKSGNLKQSNKKHKTGGHDAKRTVVKKQGGFGRVEVGHRPNVKSQAKDGKNTRANRAKQVQVQKRLDSIAKRRVESSFGAPRIVALVALADNVDLAAIQASIVGVADARDERQGPGSALQTLAFSSYKERLTVVRTHRDMVSVLDAAKIADVILFVANLAEGPEGAVDEQGLSMISALRAQSMPASIGCVQGLEGLKGRVLLEGRKWGQRFYQTELGQDIKVFEQRWAVGEAGARQQVGQLVRMLATASPRVLRWRQIRSYLLADDIQIVSSDAATGTSAVRVGGYLRGRPLHANQLVHLTGVGTMKMSQLEGPADPCPGITKGGARAAAGVGGGGMGGGVGDLSSAPVLTEADPAAQESLVVEAEPDYLGGEQTYISDAELVEAEKAQREREEREERDDMDGGMGGGGGADGKAKRPEGWSDYQASWIPSAGLPDDFDDGEDEEGGGDGGEGKMGEACGLEDVVADDTLSMAGTDGGDISVDGLDDEEEEEEGGRRVRFGADVAEGGGMANPRKGKKSEAEVDDDAYPDEVDTPTDKDARARFARYVPREGVCCVSLCVVRLCYYVVVCGQ